MKAINYLNFFFVGLPVVLGIAGIIHEVFPILGILATILTGLFQVIIAIKMIIDEPHDKNLQIYITSVILYFTTCITFPKIEYIPILKYGLVLIPILLAIYLSVIIYKKTYQ
ncbi:hypothetical protein IUY40_04130 [Flavobacterium sp. ALJ2]|uniref:hypothetical protein n=1 Tax=Flavobacterium sp. ALJ2 TaxID=2786960 RepID=UPI00189C7F95|nr:hypothetical protein [Flavobacterium sp. ALJ2]MBF7090731.1 hypothetical protein [Flavobacterium sp. ALJ2]